MPYYCIPVLSRDPIRLGQEALWHRHIVLGTVQTHNESQCLWQRAYCPNRQTKQRVGGKTEAHKMKWLAQDHSKSVIELGREHKSLDFSCYPSQGLWSLLGRLTVFVRALQCCYCYFFGILGHYKSVWMTASLNEISFKWNKKVWKLICAVRLCDRNTLVRIPLLVAPWQSKTIAASQQLLYCCISLSLPIRSVHNK